MDHIVNGLVSRMVQRHQIPCLLYTSSEFSQKVDAIDENSLSSEDSAYYTEVMTRCAQKLASVGQ